MEVMLPQTMLALSVAFRAICYQHFRVSDR
jgi:hypothetical protein